MGHEAHALEVLQVMRRMPLGTNGFLMRLRRLGLKMPEASLEASLKKVFSNTDDNFKLIFSGFSLINNPSSLVHDTVLTMDVHCSVTQLGGLPSSLLNLIPYRS